MVEFYIFLAVGLGLVFTIVGYNKRKELKRLKQSGIHVEGVVFSLEYEPPTNTSSSDGSYNSNTGTYFPVVRFLTAEKEWITEKYEVGRYPSKYQEGDKVPIIYDPASVKEFIIDDNSSGVLGLMLWFGILLIAGGIIAFILKK